MGVLPECLSVWRPELESAAVRVLGTEESAAVRVLGTEAGPLEEQPALSMVSRLSSPGICLLTFVLYRVERRQQHGCVISCICGVLVILSFHIVNTRPFCDGGHAVMKSPNGSGWPLGGCPVASSANCWSQPLC